MLQKFLVFRNNNVESARTKNLRVKFISDFGQIFGLKTLGFSLRSKTQTSKFTEL